MNHSTSAIRIHTYREGEFSEADDMLAKEEPLEIKLVHGPAGNRESTNVSITMRTPGHDLELALGFLFTEGIINNLHELEISHNTNDQSIFTNVIEIQCNEQMVVDKKLLQRNFYTTSACGVCGKASIDAVFNLAADHLIHKHFTISKNIIIQLPELLKQHQDIFKYTGGIHAAALFSKEGMLLQTREDVGRHNALDKLIGAYFLQSSGKRIIPDETILLLSGRASFELIQKSAMAGIQVICAVGAPSTLAVDTAKKFGITLIGFLRDNRFNIYSNPERIQ